MRHVKRSVWAILFAMALTVAVCASGRADDDPPGRVGRINYLKGTVSFEPAGGADNDWVTAVPNRPLTVDDRLWVDHDGRAEVHVGSTAIHLDHDTGISFLNLSDNSVQLQLSAGTVIVRLRNLDPSDSFEVDTPNLALSLLRAPGDYRVDVDPDKNVTVVTVIQGQGEVTGGGRSYRINPDQSATFTGTDNLDYDLVDAHVTPPSEFDQWSADRDRREDNFASAKYVSPEMTGSEDLDTYGTWRDVPDYGPMWVPSAVAVGWAPYRFGHWVFIAPWGWTWVEDEPWGFAPFHYGRWAYVGGVWGWMPGPRGGVGVAFVRPVYAPALVAWVGGGPGFSFSVAIGGGGGVAWFPLGPREVFVPAYHVSDRYVERVNITNTVVERTTVVNVYHNTSVTNVTYVNQRVGGGVTVVSHDTFVNARPVGRNVVAVSDRELASAPVSRGFAVEPVHASVIGAGRPAAVQPPAAVINRTAVVRRTPPPAPARFGASGDAAVGRPSNPSAPERATQPNQPNQPGQPSRPSQPNPAFRPPTAAGGAGGNQPSANQPEANQPNRNRPFGNAPNNDNQPGRGNQPSVGNQPAGNQPNPGQPSASAPAGNVPSANQPDANQPNRNRPFGNASNSDNQPGRGNQPSVGGQPGGNQPAGNRSVGNAPIASPPNGNQPGGNRPSGNTQPQAVNPNFRPAPAARQPTPAEQQSDTAKQQQWQQQHQQVHKNDRPPSKPGDKPDDRSKR